MASPSGRRSRLVFLVYVVNVTPMPRALGRRAGPGIRLGFGKAPVACPSRGGPDSATSFRLPDAWCGVSVCLLGCTTGHGRWLGVPAREASTALIAKKGGRRMNWEKRVVGSCVMCCGCLAMAVLVEIYCNDRFKTQPWFSEWAVRFVYTGSGSLATSEYARSYNILHLGERGQRCRGLWTARLPFGGPVVNI